MGKIADLMFMAAGSAGGIPSIVDSNSASSETAGSQTLSIAAPVVSTGDYVVIIMTVNNSSAITALGDLTGWTQDIYETSTAERLLVLSTTVVGNETWIGGNIECTVAAQHAACVFSVSGATTKLVGAFNSNTVSSIILSSISPSAPSLLLSLSASDNVGTVTSVVNSTYTFNSVVESSGAAVSAGEAAVYSTEVEAGDTGTVTVTIDTSLGLAGVLMAFS